MSQVRLIDQDGNQVGVVPTSDALSRARAQELDLVEISPSANPPVCKILDYGQFLYQKKKEEQKTKAKQKKTEIKTLKLSFRIAEGDLQRQLDKAQKFITEGDKVRFELRLRGREKSKPDLAKEKMEEIRLKTLVWAKTEVGVTKMMDTISFLVAPKK